MAAIAPTKGNLARIKRSLGLAKMGYELMDRKRNILIREMMQLIDKAKELQAEIDSTFTRAYSALQEANIKLGTCQDIALAAPVDDTLSLGYRSVMGVEIPIVTASDFEARLSYGFVGTDSSLDRTLYEFYRVKRLCATLAEVETSVYRLANAIKKAQKRANALQNIIIPQYTATIAFITGVLEERESHQGAQTRITRQKKRQSRGSAFFLWPALRFNRFPKGPKWRRCIFRCTRCCTGLGRNTHPAGIQTGRNRTPSCGYRR